MDFLEVCSNFNLDTNNISDVKPYGSGHIHETYKIDLVDGTGYILQKINEKVFTNIPEMQLNIEKTLDALRDKKQAGDIVPEMMSTPKGESLFTDEQGNHWRMYKFISGSHTYDRVDSGKVVYEAGKAFGRFHSMLKDLEPDSFIEILPRFHSLVWRLELFDRAIQSDTKGRVAGVRDEINFIHHKSKTMGRINELGLEGKIPLRITHNDTKINNVLFDINDNAICVIDLDTVMPGYIHYDFGDAIRTGAASADEDEPDTDKMFIRPDLFDAYARGFMKQVHTFLTSDEKRALHLAPQLMTFMIGLRFLTDYIEGDIYFKTACDDHNLVRWKAQKKLLLSMEEHEQEMAEIIRTIEMDLIK